MRYRDIPKSIEFPEHLRSAITFSDVAKLRLDPATHTLQLKADAAGAYPLDADLSAACPPFLPQTVKVWRGFHVVSFLPPGTSLGYKLNDGTIDRYWDGAAWSSAGASDWNTEEEVAANIPTYPPGALNIVANLVTTDATVTPYLHGFMVGYSARIVFLREWIYDTLIPLIRDNTRPIGAWPFPVGVTTSTIDLNDYELDAPFNIDDIDGVYNHSDDPGHFANLLASYDSGTKVITLSAPFPAGKVVWIDFLYEPEVTAFASADYVELNKAPSITIENLRVGQMVRGGATNAVINRADGSAIKYEPPWQVAIQGDIVIHAPRTNDELALYEEVLGVLTEAEAVKVGATDELVDIKVLDLYTRGNILNVSDLRECSLSFEMRWLPMWIRPAKTAGVYATRTLRLTGDVEVVI